MHRVGTNPFDKPRCLGFIVNPIAGMGGKVGLKGTDGEALWEARARNAVPIAPLRAERALARYVLCAGPSDILTGFGELGESIVRRLGAEPVRLGSPSSGPTTADDTRAAAVAMRQAGADLLLFAGGDGTARDILDAVGSGIPILGIPAGVKMHSAVFATTPENAGEIAGEFLANPPSAERLRDAEVMDIDEELLRMGRVSARLYGHARIPEARSLIRHAKSGARRSDEAALDALCAMIAARLEPGCVHVFGPGTTTQKIMRHAGLEASLLGVDAVCDGALLGADLTEEALLRLTAGRKTRIVAGVVGGQGFVFGRGNQQIGPEIIRRAGRGGITLVASLDKILALDGHRLHVDTGDAETDAMLRGYMRVETAPDQSILCRIG